MTDDPTTFASAVTRLLLEDEYWHQKREALLRLHRDWMSLPVPSWADIVQAQVRNRDIRAAS